MRFDLQIPENLQLYASIAISPDGRMIAFPASGGGDTHTRLWVRSMDSSDARPLAGTEGLNSGNVPFWLPDSRTLVFQANGQLRKIDVTGGPAQSFAILTASSAVVS